MVALPSAGLRPCWALRVRVCPGYWLRTRDRRTGMAEKQRVGRPSLFDPFFTPPKWPVSRRHRHPNFVALIIQYLVLELVDGLVSGECPFQFRLHRQWFDQSAMGVLLGSGFCGGGEGPPIRSTQRE